jgi:hypothetical protein
MLVKWRHAAITHINARGISITKETPVDFPIKERVTHLGYPPAGGKRDEKESGILRSRTRLRQLA